MKTIKILKIKFVKNYLPLTVMVICFTFFNCESLVECILNAHPELPEKQLKVGYLGEIYYDEIKASVANEPDDDGYVYYFRVEGRLPVGVWAWGNGRTFIIEGEPIETGFYTFNIVVSVEPYNSEDFICNSETSQEYTLTIEE